MIFRRRNRVRPLAAMSVTIALIVLGFGAPMTSHAAPSVSQLNNELGQEQSRQQSLAADISSLDQSIAALRNQVSAVQAREAAVRTELERDQAQLAATRAAVQREKRLLAILRARLARARKLLASQLLSGYEQDRPDLVSVVLEAHGFSDLLERLSFLSDAEHEQKTTIVVTREAKLRADRAERRLESLETTEREVTDAAAVRVRALQGMDRLLQSKESSLSQAVQAKRAALAASRSRAGQLQNQISQIQAQQAAAQQAADTSSGPSSSGGSGGVPLGPSGGWAIPYPIVLCESGGQNLPPNSAGASGYYQIIPSTWAGFGGSGPAAWLASKAEQDAVAARIWNGGAGWSNWVCAQILGIH